MKRARQQKILEIIRSRPVASQQELVEELRKAGFNVTQATVSRDLKELRLVKVATEEGWRYALPATELPAQEEKLRQLVQSAVVGIEVSGNLVVVKTLPGAAQGVASAVDRANWPEVIGTVAGDDTFIVVVRSARGLAQAVKARLYNLAFGER
ncbi:arginine repressor, ArgR [Ammonifex degensii KC4]|uniref:Arginine repressor n=1 Tax=Ammonifex degensii (strain DSM 10501 / KC4) TaxID=429009 RepID=C9R868_AMMDK|nr:arginine repressor [Ammonifex degensii]ACX52497.1 arginine repressor, ArgR [Ammonifex degensii KC4]